VSEDDAVDQQAGQQVVAAAHILGTALRRSSRDTVDGERPSSWAIARTPTPVRRSVAIR
jgi:hypothetical protein